MNQSSWLMAVSCVVLLARSLVIACGRLFVRIRSLMHRSTLAKIFLRLGLQPKDQQRDTRRQEASARHAQTDQPNAIAPHPGTGCDDKRQGADREQYQADPQESRTHDTCSGNGHVQIFWRYEEKYQ